MHITVLLEYLYHFTKGLVLASILFTGYHAYTETACNNVCAHQILSFRCRKWVGTRVCWHTCAKFKLNYAINLVWLQFSTTEPQQFEYFKHTLCFKHYTCQLGTMKSREFWGLYVIHRQIKCDLICENPT